MHPDAWPTDLAALIALVLLLGMRHGLDADHLAAIDAMTRAHAAPRPRLARRVGALFSLGHGLVVLAAALAVALLAGRWQPPAWLTAGGAWLSIALLAGLGLLNLGALLRTPAHRPVRLLGWRTVLLGRWLAAGHPLAVAAVGAVFALSFDTLSQATLIALAAARFGTGWPAAALAAGFVLGMLATDGLNSLWLSHLVRRGGEAASRLMAVTVAAVSLLTAALGAAVRTSAAAAQWAVDAGPWLSAAVVAAVLLAFAGGLLLARRGALAAPAAA